tara:strand:+ start:315 stop:428 length:114 start_codon:yes stop_codon:yes gene_type:complete
MGRNGKTFMWTMAAVVAGLAVDGYLTKNVPTYRALVS